jgi:capsular polysaccharide biosynthesis protein
MKKQEQYYVQTREINIKRMIWWIAKKWRILLIAAIIGAVIATIWKYHADDLAAEEALQVAVNAQENAAKTEEELREELTDAQILGVENTIDYRKHVEESKEYIENSVLMQLNPYAENVTYLYYDISDVPSEVETEKIVQYVNSSQFAESIKEMLECETETRYLAELIKAEKNMDEVIVQVIGADEGQCQELVDAVCELLEAYDTDLPLALINSSNEIRVDTELLTIKNDILYQYAQNTSVYNSNYGVLVSEQLSLYNFLLEKDDESINETAENDAMESENTFTKAPVYISKKMMVLGFAAGLVVGIVLCGVAYTFSTGIHGEEEIKKLFEITSFGNANISSLKKKRWFAAVDTMLDRFGYRQSKRLNYDQQVKWICSNLLLTCQKQGVTRLYLSGSEMEKIPEAFVEELKSLLAEKHIELVSGESIAYNADSLMELSEIGAGIFVEMDEVSKCEEIAKELNLCVQNQIDLLGLVMVRV